MAPERNSSDRFSLWIHRKGRDVGQCFCLDCRSNRWLLWLLVAFAPLAVFIRPFMGAFIASVTVVGMLDTLSVWIAEDDDDDEPDPGDAGDAC